MTQEKRTLTFSTTGAFITKISRDWFWREGKPWEVVQDLLLSCMCGTDHTQEELIELARKVVYGQAKFVGQTCDDTFALTDDNVDMASDYQKRMNAKVAALQEELEELQKKYDRVIDYLEDRNYYQVLRACRVGTYEGYGEDEDEDENSGLSSILASFLEEKEAEKKMKYEEPYGWLEPNGTFWPVAWCDHQEFAQKKLQEMGWEDDFYDKYDCCRLEQSGDYLVKEKHWVLLHNPGQGIAFVTAAEDWPLTKAQKEFLFGYYTDIDRHDLAAKYLED